MAFDLKQFVTAQPSDPVRNMPGSYADDVASIPEADKLQESQMPKQADKSPFELGPMSAGGR